MKRLFLKLWEWLTNLPHRYKIRKASSFLKDDEKEFREMIKSLKDGLDHVSRWR